MAIVRNTFHYAAAPPRVWAMVTDFSALAEACRRLVVFEGLPEGRIHTGQSLEVMVRLFGILPRQVYHMTVELCDEAAMRFQSRERGAGIRRWDHKLWLEPDGAGTRLNEEIDIDAGAMTPLYVLWARFLYRGRHQPRVDMLTSGAF